MLWYYYNIILHSNRMQCHDIFAIEYIRKNPEKQDYKKTGQAWECIFSCSEWLRTTGVDTDMPENTSSAAAGKDLIRRLIPA